MAEKVSVYQDLDLDLECVVVGVALHHPTISTHRNAAGDVVRTNAPAVLHIRLGTPLWLTLEVPPSDYLINTLKPGALLRVNFTLIETKG